MNIKLKNAELYSQHYLENSNQISAEDFPALRSLSSAFTFRFMPREINPKNSEFVLIDSKLFNNKNSSVKTDINFLVSQWNSAWEAGRFRFDMFEDDIPDSLKWLKQYKSNNIYLLPKFPSKNYFLYSPIYHLLPKHILEYNKLPLLKRGNWPHSIVFPIYYEILPKDFDKRLSQAFSFYIWPYLLSSSTIHSFTENDPLKILAHNLNFWLPSVNKAIEEKISSWGRIPPEDNEQKLELIKYRNELPKDSELNRPYYGGYLWYGESESKKFLKRIIEIADSEGQLRNIIDAVKSNRVEDDFSEKWSFAKEDFERALFKKRSSYKLKFVEIEDAFSLQGPENEVEGNIIWGDFISLLDEKEKQIVILLNKGYSKLTEISKILGYANHSPVSKKMKKIQKKVIDYLSK